MDVTTPVPGPDRHLEVLRQEGERMAAMPVELLGAPVPAVEGWTLEKVVRHSARVHAWVSAFLASPPGTAVADVAPPGQLPPAPRGPACLPAYRQALEALLAELSRRRPDEPTMTFGGPGAVAFWARRQANEIAVHRLDAADAVHAAGGPAPEPLDLDVATDGVDEWAGLFLAVRYAQRHGDLPAELVGRTVGLTAVGGAGAGRPDPRWSVALAADGVAVDGPGPGELPAVADVELRGPAQDLLQVLWRRRPLGQVAVDGDRAVAERLLDVARF